MLQGLGQVSPQATVAIFGEGFETPDEEGKEGENGKLAGDAGEAEGDEGAVFVDDDIDGDADEIGWGEVEDGVEDGAGDGAPDWQLVGFAVSKKAKDRRKNHDTGQQHNLNGVIEANMPLGVINL